jgi:hypothetical protein
LGANVEEAPILPLRARDDGICTGVHACGSVMGLAVSEVSFALVLQDVLGDGEAQLRDDHPPARFVTLRLAVQGPAVVAQAACPACPGLGAQRLGG